MFPEYRDLISRLKNEDRHFERLFNEHNDLDEKITELEKHISPVGEVEIETLKKQKLALKDEIYQILLKASAK
ncbi:MAG: YdcH family protein [Brachymonas sp.]|mgnify:FL=1|nr:YdcH family protein [Brachymonas sp.]